VLQSHVMGVYQLTMANSQMRSYFLSSALAGVCITLLGMVGSLDSRNHDWSVSLLTCGLLGTGMTGLAMSVTQTVD
jgi:hypothetical protein